MSILQETTDLLELGLYLTGKTEVPKQWFEWSLISMIAASVGNRVYYQRMPWSRIHPNMYVFLIGKSGVGKGEAINFALQLRHPVQNIWFGEATNKALKDRFGSTDSILPPDGSTPPWVIYLVQQELADAVGTGKFADAYIKSMTNWYNPTTHDFAEGTRTHGEKTHPPPCINWLAGTTVEWLLDSIPRETLLSGFFGRVVPVPGEYDWGTRIYDPLIFAPPDYEEVLLYICRRIHALTAIPHGSPMKITARAREIDKLWYEGMEQPEPELEPFARREPDLATKLAMIFSLCRSQSLTIEEQDITRAHHMVVQARRALRNLVHSSVGSRIYLMVDGLRDFMRQKGTWVTRAALSQFATRWHVSPRELDEALKEIESQGMLETQIKGQRRQYRYKSNTKIKLRMVNDQQD